MRPECSSLLQLYQKFYQKIKLIKYLINRLVISSQVNERKKTIFQIPSQSVVSGMTELIIFAKSTKGQFHTFKLLIHIQSESTLRWRNLKVQLSFYSQCSTAHTNPSKTGIACVTAAPLPGYGKQSFRNEVFWNAGLSFTCGRKLF